MHSWSPNHDIVQIVTAEKSKAARTNLKLFADLSYGVHVDQKLDILTNNLSDAPVHVFFHGGGWLRGTKSSACFYAEMIVGAGALFVAVNFSKINQAPLPEIVHQSRQAISWVHQNIRDYGGDPDKIYVCGKSSGAQQAGMVMLADWSKYNLPADVIKGTVLISGVYDLEPLGFTQKAKVIGLDPVIVETLSPSRNISKINGDLTLVFAEEDSPEIRRQSIDFGQKWRDAGNSCQLVAEKGVDHFSINKPMGIASSDVGRAILGQMALASE